MGLYLRGRVRPTQWHGWRRVLEVDDDGTRHRRVVLVARVGDMIMGSVAFIYPDAASARDDHEVGGTGFLLSLPFGGNQGSELDHLYVATARHLLIDGKTKGQ